MNKNKKGFTLAELLIVVAIIAVLVAIAIPVFSAQKDKANAAVDAANIRALYAEAMADYVSTGQTGPKDYTTKTYKTIGDSADLADSFTLGGNSSVSWTSGKTVHIKVTDSTGAWTLEGAN